MSYCNPDQFTEPQADLEPDTLENQVAEYIDTAVLGNCLVEEMVDQGLELNLDNAKKVWLDVLENLHSQLEVSVDRISDRVPC